MNMRRPRPVSHPGKVGSQSARKSTAHTEAEHVARRPKADVSAEGARKARRTASQASTKPEMREEVSPRSIEQALPRSTEQVSRARNRNWDVVIEGNNKTRRFSLRLAAVVASLMLAVVIVANPLRSYIAQQEQLRDLSGKVSAQQQRLEELEQEIALWNDPEFIKSQARKRLSYVMPGETLYLVDPQAVTGEESDYQKRLEQVSQERRAATPFYLTVLESLSVSGKIDTSENPGSVPIINDATTTTDNSSESGDTPSGGSADTEPASENGK